MTAILIKSILGLFIWHAVNTLIYKKSKFENTDTRISCQNC
jgi:hypothetical protein